MSYICDVIYLDIFIYIYFYDCSNYFIWFQCSSFELPWILCLSALLCCMWLFWDTAQSLGLTASGALVSANLKDNASRELLQPVPTPYTTTYSHHAMSPKQLCLTSLWPFCTASSGLFYPCLTHEWACEREYMWQRSGQLPFRFLTALVVSLPHRDSQLKFTRCHAVSDRQSKAVLFLDSLQRKTNTERQESTEEMSPLWHYIFSRSRAFVRYASILD